MRIWVSSVFLLSVISLSVEAQTATQSRRNYPGGKDDSDLTVQTLRKITRKGEDLDPEYQGHGEPLEEGSPPPLGQGFGE